MGETGLRPQGGLVQVVELSQSAGKQLPIDDAFCKPFGRDERIRHGMGEASEIAVGVRRIHDDKIAGPLDRADGLREAANSMLSFSSSFSVVPRATQNCTDSFKFRRACLAQARRLSI
jgi:hypothetical protein